MCKEKRNDLSSLTRVTDSKPLYMFLYTVFAEPLLGARMLRRVTYIHVYQAHT